MDAKPSVAMPAPAEFKAEFTAPPGGKMPFLDPKHRVVDQQSGADRIAPPTEEERAAKMAERRARWDAAGLAEGGGQPAAEEEAQVQAREPEPESIEFTLLSGKQVHYGPPIGVSLSLATAEVLGPEADSNIKVAAARMALCLRSIDGVSIKRPENKVQVYKIINGLSESDFDTLYAIHTKVWPPVSVKDLPLIKKHFR